MDDDGSCHSESIYRVLSIFQHSQIQDLALVGTLLAEEKPNIILQSGAKYQYRGWKNINFGENISSRLGIFDQKGHLKSQTMGHGRFTRSKFRP